MVVRKIPRRHIIPLSMKLTECVSQHPSLKALERVFIPDSSPLLCLLTHNHGKLAEVSKLHYVTAAIIIQTCLTGLQQLMLSHSCGEVIVIEFLCSAVAVSVAAFCCSLKQRLCSHGEQ